MPWNVMIVGNDMQGSAKHPRGPSYAVAGPGGVSAGGMDARVAG